MNNFFFLQSVVTSRSFAFVLSNSAKYCVHQIQIQEEWHHLLQSYSLMISLFYMQARPGLWQQTSYRKTVNGTSVRSLITKRHVLPNHRKHNIKRHGHSSQSLGLSKAIRAGSKSMEVGKITRRRNGQTTSKAVLGSPLGFQENIREPVAAIGGNMKTCPYGHSR